MFLRSHEICLLVGLLTLYDQYTLSDFLLGYFCLFEASSTPSASAGATDQFYSKIMTDTSKRRSKSSPKFPQDFSSLRVRNGPKLATEKNISLPCHADQQETGGNGQQRALSPVHILTSYDI